MRNETWIRVERSTKFSLTEARLPCCPTGPLTTSRQGKFQQRWMEMELNQQPTDCRVNSYYHYDKKAPKQTKHLK